MKVSQARQQVDRFAEGEINAYWIPGGERGIGCIGLKPMLGYSAEGLVTIFLLSKNIRIRPREFL